MYRNLVLQSEEIKQAIADYVIEHEKLSSGSYKMISTTIVLEDDIKAIVRFKREV